MSRGFVYVREAETLMVEAQRVLDAKVAECEAKGLTDWSKIKNVIKDALGEYVWKATKRRPMIIPIIMEVNN